MTTAPKIRGIDGDLWQRLRIAALTRRLSMGALLNLIIREWLARET